MIEQELDTTTANTRLIVHNADATRTRNIEWFIILSHLSVGSFLLTLSFYGQQYDCDPKTPLAYCGFTALGISAGFFTSRFLRKPEPSNHHQNTTGFENV